MNILVTGGAGFIGNHVVEKLEDRGHDVTVYDISKPQVSEVEHIQADIFDFVSLSEAVMDNEVIIHLTGLANARAAQSNPMRSFRLNILSVQNLLEACRSKDRKLIFPSSAAVYGRTEELPVAENHSVNPTNVYAWHKRLSERLVQMYGENFDVDYVIFRLFNVYGKGGGGVINIFLKKARNEGKIDLFGGEQYRDFVYGGDVAEAFSRAITYEQAENEIINIGTGDGIKIKEVPEIISEFYSNIEVRKKESDNPEYDSIPDITKSKNLLDLNPKGTKEYIKKVIEKEMV